MPGVFQNCYQNREAKITKSFCSGKINVLFDGFTYNTRGHFAHCSYLLAEYPRVLYVKLSNKIKILTASWETKEPNAEYIFSQRRQYKVVLPSQNRI